MSALINPCTFMAMANDNHSTDGKKLFNAHTLLPASPTKLRSSNKLAPGYIRNKDTNNGSSGDWTLFS
jgi:hypothetical protein